jgi:deoxyribonuclease-4
MEIGTHIQKRKQFFLSLRAFYEHEENKNRPCQIFTGSPKFWRRPFLQAEDILKTQRYVDEHNLFVYIHSIYLCNLCKPFIVFREKAFACLKWEFETGMLLHFKGVVVHCGKSLKMPLDEALDNMYKNILVMLPYINPTCPLLLETSSGQGSETLYQYDALKEFYDRFSPEQKQRIKICVDTCHVFAAGHDPLEFLQKWEKAHPNSLVLVHYNDSKECCGSKKDRHAAPGEGHIGAEKMSLIADWCQERNLPMILE